MHLPLSKFLPAFNASWADQVTVHHLLSNRSGLPNHFQLPGWNAGKYQQTVPQQELLNEIAQMELTFTPGTQYQYSNLGWLLLGELVEGITQKSLQDNFNTLIFAPAAMAHSGLVYQSDVSLVSQFRWGQKRWLES